MEKSEIVFPEDYWDKQGGSETGITQYRIQYREILLFDEADHIKGGFPEKKIDVMSAFSVVWQKRMEIIGNVVIGVGHYRCVSQNLGQ